MCLYQVIMTVMMTIRMPVGQGDCYVIDVSQSVDLDHPHALDFLREDCQHVNEFFQRKGETEHDTFGRKHRRQHCSRHAYLLGG